MTRYHDMWKEAKNKVNTAVDPNRIRLYEYGWDNYRVTSANTLVKLGYIEPIIVPSYANNNVLVGYYKKLNNIPTDLCWMDAKELAKNKTLD